MEWHRITDPNDPHLDALAADYRLHPLQYRRPSTSSPERQGGGGDAYLFTVLKPVDGLVDSYFPNLDRFDDVIDELEDQVLARPSPAILSKIFESKRSLIELRRLLG